MEEESEEVRAAVALRARRAGDRDAWEGQKWRDRRERVSAPGAGIGNLTSAAFPVSTGNVRSAGPP